MSEERVEYIHLPTGSALPSILAQPRRILVLVDDDVTEEWRDDVSDWIVESGCLYMMAWGRDCSAWDDSVHHSSLRRFDYEEVPDNQFIMTTWHQNDPLHEVFFFARMCAFHPDIPLPSLTILDIRTNARETVIRALYEAERAGLLEDAYGDARDLPFYDRLKILMRTK